MPSTSRTNLHSSSSASFSSSASSTTSSSARERASKSNASLSSSSGSAVSLGASTSPRSVHFNERCILIPEQRSPRIPSLFRTNTLEVNIPVVPWRWPVLGPLSSPPTKERERELLDGGRDVARVDATQADGAEGPSSPRSPNHEVQHVVLKVPYPAFRRKSRSQISPVGLRPCLRHSTSNPAPSALPTLSRNKSTDSFVPRKPKRSVSLPPLSLDPDIKTVPLRPCCEKCLAASEVHWDNRRKRLPTLEESSREHTPSQSRLDLCEDVRTGSNTRGRSVVQSNGAVVDNDEDWCAGLHFTKGAYKLWRSASADSAHVPQHYQEVSSGLLGSLVRVDEVDRKRGSSPNASVSALGSTTESNGREDTLTLNLHNLDRVKDTDRLAPPSPNGVRSPVGSDNASEEDLFPLPSPKRLSPVATPSDSATCLPAQVSGSPVPIVTEPRYLEAAIRTKMAANGREAERKMKVQATVESSAAFSAAIDSSNPQKSLEAGWRTRADTDVLKTGSSAPIPIPGAGLREGVSHFRSHLDEIKWDPSLPDPDALPPDSTILLNSPPRSPPLGAVSPSLQSSSDREEEEEGWGNAFPLPHIPNISHPHLPHVSVSLPSLSLHLPEIPISPLSKSGSGVSSEPVAVPAPSAAEDSVSKPPEFDGDTSITPSSPPLSPSTSPTTSRPERSQSPESSPERTRGPAGGNRRASLSNIMRASVGVLKGLSLGGPHLAPAGVATGVGGVGTSVGNVESAGTGAGVSMSRGLVA